VYRIVPKYFDVDLSSKEKRVFFLRKTMIKTDNTVIFIEKYL